MPVNTEQIAEAAKQSLKTASQNARQATSIDAALEIQAEGFKQAIKTAFDTFLQQAKVNGGTCAPNGPIANGIIQ